VTNPSSPFPPARTPDGRWWWDGFRWQPVLDASAPTPAPTVAPPPAQPAWRPQQPPHGEHPGRTAAIAISVVVMVVVLAMWGLAALGGSALKQQQSSATTVEVRAALASAAVVERTYLINTGTYLPDQKTLLSNGFVPAPGIDVHVVSGTATTFCLAGGPIGAAPVMWATERDTALTTPCR
jgi:hypothetical protein